MVGKTLNVKTSVDEPVQFSFTGNEAEGKLPPGKTF